jgi:hypothetical protein
LEQRGGIQHGEERGVGLVTRREEVGLKERERERATSIVSIIGISQIWKEGISQTVSVLDSGWAQRGNARKF